MMHIMYNLPNQPVFLFLFFLERVSSLQIAKITTYSELVILAIHFLKINSYSEPIPLQLKD